MFVLCFSSLQSPYFDSLCVFVTCTMSRLFSLFFTPSAFSVFSHFTIIGISTTPTTINSRIFKCKLLFTKKVFRFIDNFTFSLITATNEEESSTFICIYQHFLARASLITVNLQQQTTTHSRKGSLAFCFALIRKMFNVFSTFLVYGKLELLLFCKTKIC